MIPSPPRRISFKLFWALFVKQLGFVIAGGSLIVFGLINFAVMSFILGVFEGFDEDYSAIEENGSRGTAVIMEFEGDQSTQINGANPTNVYYTYFDGRDSISDKMSSLDVRTLSTLDVGDTVEVVFNNEASYLPMLESASFFQNVPFGFFRAIPWILIGSGIICLLIATIPALRRCQIYKRGIAVKTKATKIISESGAHSISGDGTHTVFFQTRNGQGKSKVKAEWFREELQEGDELTVLEIPARPDRSLVPDPSILARAGWYVD